MRRTNIGCDVCRYNCNFQCTKDGICTGPVRYETYASTTSEQNYVPANTSILPDELEINGVKYRRLKNER